MTFEQKIEQVLEQKIRPVLSAHGGNVRLADCQDGLVTVLLSGACSGCPAADLSTRAYIEEVLCAELPEISRVETACSTQPELLAFARQILLGG